MKGRAYAQIGRSKGILGLRLVNPHQQAFFIYAKYALRMLAAPGEYVLVKKRDRDPTQATYYHGGEVIGCLEHLSEEGAESSLLTLHFGPIEQRIEFKEETGELLHVIEEQEYRFPQQELALILDCLALMVKQKDRFEQLLLEARDLPGSEVLIA